MAIISVKSGESMRKKRFLVVFGVILLFSMLFSSLSVGQVTLGCCVSDTDCSQTTIGSCTSGTYYSVACSQINNCDIGCCCEDTLNSNNVVVTTKKHCDGVGGFFSDLSAYTRATATYVSGCKTYCGLGTQDCVSNLYCKDGTTVLAACVNGKYFVSPGAKCLAAAGAFVDTDGDGVPDDQDLCPNERLLTVPEETAETSCPKARGTP